MAAEIKKQTGVDSELIAGGGGIFDVMVDGKMIFSKHEKERFPEDSEILDQLKAAT